MVLRSQCPRALRAALQRRLLPLPTQCHPRGPLPGSTPRWLEHQQPLAKPTGAKGMEEAEAEPGVPRPPPRPGNRPPPSAPLGSRLVPVVVHTGGRPLSSFRFVFYRPGWPNSLAPFCTAQKPSCGFRFQEGTVHGRARLAVPSTDIRKWRACHGPKP